MKNLQTLKNLKTIVLSLAGLTTLSISASQTLAQEINYTQKRINGPALGCSSAIITNNLENMRGDRGMYMLQDALSAKICHIYEYGKQVRVVFGDENYACVVQGWERNPVCLYVNVKYLDQVY